MVKSGQYDKAWKYYELMEREGFLPSGKTFKGLSHQPCFDIASSTSQDFKEFHPLIKNINQEPCSVYLAINF